MPDCTNCSLGIREYSMSYGNPNVICICEIAATSRHTVACQRPRKREKIKNTRGHTSVLFTRPVK